MSQKTTFARCKSCSEVVEVPLPEPEKVVTKEPCKCGLTESARMSRHWATAIAIAAMFAAVSGYGGCRIVNQSEIERNKSAIEEYRADALKHKADMEHYRTELEKYKAVLGELKAASPAGERFVAPEKK